MKILYVDKHAIKEAFKNGEINVVVFGLGKLGLPLAAVIASKGARVIGVDINERLVEKINNGENPLPNEPGLGELLSRVVGEGKLIATTDWEKAVREGDVYIIIVPVVVDSIGKPKLDIIFDVVEKISLGLEKGDIVIIETTLPIGTTRRIAKVLEEKTGLKCGKDFGVAHAPERTMSGRMIKDITESYFKVVGADDERTLEAVGAFYEMINSKGVIKVKSSITAEAVKVFEGVYRYVNIALANELAIYAEKKGFDVMEAIRVANTQPYSHIHVPGAGVGGHCIPVYIRFVLYDALENRISLQLMDAARRTNENMPLHTVLLTVKALNEIGKPVRGSKVLIVGVAYKPHIREYYNSPAFRVIKELREMGAELFVYDPVATDEDLGKLFNVPRWKGGSVDVAVILTGYPEFAEMIYERKVQVKAIVDGRRLLDPEKVKSLGYVYKAIGLGL